MATAAFGKSAISEKYPVRGRKKKKKKGFLSAPPVLPKGNKQGNRPENLALALQGQRDE